MSNTATIAEGVISILIGWDAIDESNPQIIREIYLENAKKMGLTAHDFYEKLYEPDEWGEYAELDMVVEQILGTREPQVLST